MNTEKRTEITLVTIIISLTIVIVSLIAGVTIYNVNDRNLMSKNIENAMEKGIDPLAVRCSYQTQNDVVCSVYTVSIKK